MKPKTKRKAVVRKITRKGKTQFVKKVSKIKRLTALELKKLTKVLERLEAPMYRVYRKLSGGFSEAKMFDYDEDFIDVELAFGMEDGDGSSVTKETYKIDRATMEIID